MTGGENRPKRPIELLLAGDVAGAITDLRAHLEKEPDDEQAWLELGLAFFAIDHLPDAAMALAKSVALDGSNVAARRAYARTLVRMGKLDDAAFQLLQAAKADPEDALVMHELGVVFYDKRLFEKAATWLTRASEAAPNDGRSPYALGLACEGQRDLGAAIAAYRESVRRDPTLLDAHRTLADALAATGEHEAAIEALTAALAIDRNSEEIAHNREVLAHALREMKARKLLGKTRAELEASALVQEGGLAAKGELPSDEPGARVLRYRASLVEVLATVDEAGAIRSLALLLTDPDRAARAKDDTFGVTIVGKDGTHEAVDYGTAATLTFLREALGCPMTSASALYARLLAGDEDVEWGGARLSFTTVGEPDKPAKARHGILVRG